MIIFTFDPTRSALLLLGGDKADDWERWYRDNIPLAEQLCIAMTPNRVAVRADADLRPGRITDTRQLHVSSTG